MSDEATELENELEQERTQMAQLTTMINSPGWKILQGVMMSQERLRRNEVFTHPGKGIDGLIEQGKLVSELGGINTTMQMPHNMITDSKLRLEGLLEQIEALESGEEFDHDDLERI